MAEPDRVRILHKARMMIDTQKIVDKIAMNAHHERPEIKRQKCVKGAPAYVRSRVDKGQLLPEVEVVKPRRGLYAGCEREQDMRADMVEYVIGWLPSEVFVTLVDIDVAHVG